MIKYALSCENGHEFEGWFSNSADFDEQKKRSLLTCPQCESSSISKMLMTPQVGPSTKGKDLVPVAAANPMQAQMVEKIRQLKREIEKNADNVGEEFPEEARKIHYGEKEERGIYGESTVDEAKELAEEGIPVAPIPWMEEPKEH